MNRIRRAALVFALGMLAPAGAVRAQTVMVRALDTEGAAPVQGALVRLLDTDGALARSALTDELGRTLFVGVGPGLWAVRVEMIGRETSLDGPFEVPAEGTVVREVRMASSAIVLDGIEVAATERCEIRGGDEGLLVAEVWDEARKALEAAALLQDRGTNRYETVRYERTIDAYDMTILAEERSARDAYMRTPFESRPAPELVRAGFVQKDGEEDVYYAPDAEALLSDAFLDTHCLRLLEDRNEDGHLGLAFEPTNDDRDVPDIEGVMWLDPESVELRWLEYRYTGIAQEKRSPMVGGRVDFRRLPDGRWIVPEWWIRMPVIGVREDLEGGRHMRIVQYRQSGGLVTNVHEAGGRTLGGMAQTGGIEGVVRDSLGAPLPGVRVGVVGSNQEVYTNARGEYGITGLAAGTYRVRFVDQRLEIMGYVPEPVEREVIRGEMSFLEFMTPSVGDVLFQACRDEPAELRTARLAGIVVDERGEPVPGAVVSVGTSEFRAGGAALITPGTPIYEHETVKEQDTSDTGFFRFCSVPIETRLVLRAADGDGRVAERIVRIEPYVPGQMVVLELVEGTDPGAGSYK